MIGQHLIKRWLVPVAKPWACSHALLNLARISRGEIFADASAALGIIARTGPGKVRHLGCQARLLQDVREEKGLFFAKVPGEDKPSDAGIQYMAQEPLEAHFRTIGNLV